MPENAKLSSVVIREKKNDRDQGQTTELMKNLATMNDRNQNAREI